MVPNDPFYKYQWHLDNPVYGGIEAEEAWNTSTGSGVTVAVIDTGVAYENYTEKNRRNKYYRAPDLAVTLFAPGYDFVNKDTHPNDDEGHGTHVTGTIAQSTNNGVGVAGVAHKARIMPIKVLNKNGSGTYADIALGVRFATDNGAKVINMSLGGSAKASYLEEALAYAYGKGVTIVAAKQATAGMTPPPTLPDMTRMSFQLERLAMMKPWRHTQTTAQVLTSLLQAAISRLIKMATATETASYSKHSADKQIIGDTISITEHPWQALMWRESPHCSLQTAMPPHLPM